MIRFLAMLSLLLPSSALLAAEPPTWPQFNGLGRSVSLTDQRIPDRFGPEENVLWKRALPRGSSSPCIWGDRLFVTGAEDDQLCVICLDRKTGEPRWRTNFTASKESYFHPDSSPAAPTTCTDGQRVYAYFGGYGLIALDMKGDVVWEQRFKSVPTQFGHGASPLLHEGAIYLVRDLNQRSSLRCYDARTGEPRWVTPRPEAQANFSTPIVWRGQLIVAGTSMVKAYDLHDGKPIWWVEGLTLIACTSPVATEDVLYFGGWSTGNVAPERRLATGFDADSGLSEEELQSVPKIFAKLDTDGDGKLAPSEVPASRAKDAFALFDFNRDGHWEPRELQGLVSFPTAPGRNILVAIKPGGKGDVTDTHVLWEKSRGIPYVATPLVYRGGLYYYKKGGFASRVDAETGKADYESKRLGVAGEYYATAIGVGDRVLVAAERGTVFVLDAGKRLKVIARNTFDEEIAATPAVVENTLYLRTAGHLYAIRDLSDQSSE